MMSRCAKCNSSFFELVEQSPQNANYKIWFVQCSQCGSPVGAMEYFTAWTQMNRIDKKIDSLESKLNRI